jgi:DNA-directed RNA polymerase subunit RPC12/RpoP
MDYATLSETINPLAFLHNNKIKNENGQLIEFKDHYFLIKPYADMTPRQVVMKASQVGWSVLAINKAMWLAKYKKANVIYTLPSKSIVKDFVTPKVDPIIMQNPLYQQMVGKTDSIALKNIGDRFVYFRGSWEETAAISISAHVLINDEADRSNQKVLRVYKTRLDDARRERPDLGFIWQFSNPSIPGYGVDEVWQESDQKHWFVKCPHCNYDWYLKFPDNIDFEREVYICAQCHKDLPDEARRVGRWVNKRTSDISGYWISQLMIPWIPASKIIEDSLGDKQVFHNFTLGLPYISADTSVSRKTITDCLVPGANPLTGVAIGVDNGVVKTVVIGNAYGIFRTYETENWDDIEADIKRYNAYCVIDSNPYPAMPIKLANKYRGRVYVHFFVQDQKDLKVIKWGESDKQYVVQSDRTKILDMLVGEFMNKEVVFNMTLAELEQYIYDWGQLYRTIEENTKGIQRPVWRTIEGRRDHYAFATIYWRIALEKTYSDSGVVRSPLTKRQQPDSVIVSPGRTVPAIDLKKVIDRSKGKRDWRTK